MFLFADVVCFYRKSRWQTEWYCHCAIFEFLWKFTYSIHTIYKTIRAINVRFFEYYQTENEICYKISNFIIKILFLVRDKILFIILFAL